MLDNSVVQQHHFIIFRPDRSCELVLSNNVIFMDMSVILYVASVFDELMTRL